MITRYICEYCKKEFHSEWDCKSHEKVCGLPLEKFLEYIGKWYTISDSGDYSSFSSFVCPLSKDENRWAEDLPKLRCLVIVITEYYDSREAELEARIESLTSASFAGYEEISREEVEKELRKIGGSDGVIFDINLTNVKERESE